jgi:hypothetical protein
VLLEEACRDWEKSRCNKDICIFRRMHIKETVRWSIEDFEDRDANKVALPDLDPVLFPSHEAFSAVLVFPV